MGPKRACAVIYFQIWQNFWNQRQKLPLSTKFHGNWLNIEETDQNGPKKGVSSNFFSNLTKFLKSAPKITPEYQISCKLVKYWSVKIRTKTNWKTDWIPWFWILPANLNIHSGEVNNILSSLFNVLILYLIYTSNFTYYLLLVSLV